jgi:hypothetical protein
VFAGAAVGVGFLKPILAKYVGSLLPFGQFNGPILTAGTGYLASWIFDMLPVTFLKRMSHPAVIVGLSAAIIELINPYVRGFLGTVQSPLLSGPRHAVRPLRGIGAWPPVPGMAQWIGAGAPAAVAAKSGAGMQGIGAWPGVPPMAQWLGKH